MQPIESTLRPCAPAGEEYHCWAPQRLLASSRWFEYHLAAPRTRGNNEGGAVRADYVLRKIRPELTEERRWQAIDRLSRRLLAAEAVKHPGAMPVLDAEVDRAPFFLIEPYLPETTLEQFEGQRGSISRVIWILRQVAEIVSATHDSDRVHLDLCPHHVYLSRDGKVTLTGWSNTHRVGQRTWLPLETTQDAAYRAPESADSDYRAHPSADIYAWGLLAYWLLTGQAACQAAGDAPAEILKAHRRQIPVDAQVRQPACPGGLNQLITCALAKHPMRRPHTKSLVDALISIEIDHLHDQRSLAWTLPSRSS